MQFSRLKTHGLNRRGRFKHTGSLFARLRRNIFLIGNCLVQKLFPLRLCLLLNRLRRNRLNRSTGHCRLLHRLHRGRLIDNNRLRFSLPEMIYVPINRLCLYLTSKRFLTIGRIKHRQRTRRFCRSSRMRHFNGNRFCLICSLCRWNIFCRLSKIQRNCIFCHRLVRLFLRK